MKGNVPVIVLLLACIGLGVFLYRQKAQSDDAQKQSQATIMILTNELQKTAIELDKEKAETSRLMTTLNERTAELGAASNRLVAMQSSLEQSQEQARQAAENAATEIAAREQKISELEGQKDDLSRKMSDLNVSLEELERQIVETERKLSASEGDREFLLGELRRLQSEKAELERQFYDLALLREQVERLKDELALSRRLEWVRNRLYGNEQKGSEKLQPGFATPAGESQPDLNVEIRQDGGATVAPPTNAPAP